MDVFRRARSAGSTVRRTALQAGRAAAGAAVRVNWRDAWLMTITVLGMVTIVVGFARIDDSRRQTIKIACLEQNARHDTVLRVLDGLLAGLPPGPQRDRALAGRSSTVLLLEALAPRQDCDARAKRLVAARLFRRVRG